MRFSLALAVLLATAVSAEPPSTLVRYSFDEHVDTGPDTFAIFQHAKGTVRVVGSPRLSGYRSLEIRDVAGDGEFPELQGYFALRRHGRLYAHFAFLATDVLQDFNIALAGPAHFLIRKDGIAFWLAAKDGWLVHYPATRVTGPSRLAAVGLATPTRLARLLPFVWYAVDVTYDIDAGVYAFDVHQEGQDDPVVHLTNQKNAAALPGSAVDKFSFIGDLDDAFAATYYVDDVVIGTDEKIVQLPFVAPGRRRLFVDRLADAARETRERSCLPIFEAGDLGLTGSDIEALRSAGQLDALAAAVSGQVVEAVPTSGLGAETRRRLDAAQGWAEGCTALEADPARALRSFERAASLVPEATIFGPSSILALARLGRWDEVERRLQATSWSWHQDPRYGVLLSLLGTGRGGLDEAEGWLRTPAEGSAEGGAPNVAAPLVTSAYYYVLLTKGEYARAQDYAQRMAKRIEAQGDSPAEWLERAGDAAVFLKRFPEARELYEKSRALSTYTVPVLLKLSDVAFIEGDLKKERSLREQIYGTLRGAP